MAARAKQAAQPPFIEKVVFLVSLGFELCVRSAPLCIIFASVIFGATQLWKNASSGNHFKIKPSVSIEGQGVSEALKEYKRLGRFAVGRSLLDPLLLCDLKRQYMTSPWVSEVCSLKRVFPDKVYVEFIPREPFVQVLDGGYYWLVDNEGVLLPVAGNRVSRKGLPVIRGDINNRPRNGMFWNDSGVLGGVRALNNLRSSAMASTMPVREILIERPGFIDRLSTPGKSRPRLKMSTANGYSILWGTVSQDFPGELTDSEKIALLRQLVAECRGSAQHGISFDVRTNVAGFRVMP